MKATMKNRQKLRATPRITSTLPSGFLIAAAVALTAAGCKKAAPPQLPPPVVQVMEVAKKKVARSTTFIGKLDCAGMLVGSNSVQIDAANPENVNIIIMS